MNIVGSTLAETQLHDSSRAAAHRSIEVRCPHCHAPNQVEVDTAHTNVHCSGCGSHFSLTGDSRHPRSSGSLTQIAHFELLERLGVGAFGTVWKARDTKLDRLVALKIPRYGKLSADQTEKFLREARAAAQLRHPNIVSIHEVGFHDDTLYLVSDLVRGVALDDWLLEGNKLTQGEAAQLCITLARALHHAHEAGVVHRDLKPGNILMDEKFQPNIADFGLAKRDLSIYVTLSLAGSHEAVAEIAIFNIDSSESRIRVVPGVPNGDPGTGFVVQEGTRFANTVAVMEQVPGGLESAVTGTLSADVSGTAITFSGGSRLDAAANPGGPFQPSPAAEGGTGSMAEEDNFGGLGAFLRPDQIVAMLAVRDGVADIVSGSATVGGSVQGLEFDITAGVFDVMLTEFELIEFYELTELLEPVYNQASEPLTGSLEGTIRIPIYLDFEFRTFSEPHEAPDSRLILEGQIVATRESALAGDYDGNGRVEQGDLDLVLLNWGAGAVPPPSGWIRSLPAGQIDQDELDGVLLNWGSMGAVRLPAAVPEPGSFLLGMLVLFAEAWFTRRPLSRRSSFG